MNVIDTYLDTLFAPYPRTARLREAREELRAMMEDKQQSLMDQGLTEPQAVGRVIAEFGSLEEIAPELGIGADLAPGAPAGPPPLERERAEEYVGAVRRSQGLLCGGIALFVLCPVPLLLLIALTGGQTAQPPAWATLVGMVSLLVMVTIGVLMLVVRGTRIADFEDIEKGAFAPTTEVRAYATELRREHRGRAGISLAVAIALWILCAVPILVPALLTDGEDDPSVLLGVCLTLIMVAAGLWILLRSAWAGSAADSLENVADPDEVALSEAPPAIRILASVYWPLATIIYLVWSFSTGDWGISWLVWPVAGVLYGALWAAVGALRTADDARR